MTNKVEVINEMTTPMDTAAWVSNLWTKWDNQRAEYKALKKELRSYLFATDTKTTTNNQLPWKHTTTIPKLCQIRDNLHSNYLQSLFPNDKWVKWMSYRQEDESRDKAETIEAYISNKARMSGYMDTTSALLFDYIDGNAFATVVYEDNARYTKDGRYLAGYTGPRLVRIDPNDIVFDISAVDFESAPKVVRSWKNIGGLIKALPKEPYWKAALEYRAEVARHYNGLDSSDQDKVTAYYAEGFGSYGEYLGSGLVEVLEFYGDYYNSDTGELELNRIITVVDRSIVVRNETIDTFSGNANIYHIGWRKRPDNLLSMGPLDNLVGMQYKIDHLENARADAFDLALSPPKVIQGEVEAFEWKPDAEIFVDENGGVTELGLNLNAIITAASNIQEYEDKMEMFAGAPREAMGIRTPGEKTAFEVQRLENAAGRIFQEKILSFELNMLEPTLNAMLEESLRNFNGNDVVRVVDDDLKAVDFRTITKEDITASGVIRPVGARHFAQQAQELQNIIGVFNSPLGQMVAPHTSSLQMTKLIENVLDITGYDLFEENIAIIEQKNTQGMMNQASEDLEVQQSVPTAEEVVVEE